MVSVQLKFAVQYGGYSIQWSSTIQHSSARRKIWFHISSDWNATTEHLMLLLLMWRPQTCNRYQRGMEIEAAVRSFSCLISLGEVITFVVSLVSKYPRRRHFEDLQLSPSLTNVQMQPRTFTVIYLTCQFSTLTWRSSEEDVGVLTWLLRRELSDFSSLLPISAYDLMCLKHGNCDLITG